MSRQVYPSEHSPEKKQSQIIKRLLAKIKLAAETGDFRAAKMLRDKLMEIAPMAINEGIRSAELIENKMSAAIDKYHLEIWPELYDSLTIEERNCLFHSMKKYTLPEKQILLKYGSFNNRLFFLEKGKVTVGIPREENKFKVLAQLGRGDVLGEYTFATIALCSASAVTKTAVEVRCLEGQLAESWEEKHPGLYNKVLEFCKKYGRIDQISQRKEQENHTYPRYPVQGYVKAILLDKSGQKTKIKLNGELEEISRSGTSFSIHCNKISTVKLLLAKSFSLAFTCKIKGKEISFSSIGRVIRVSFLLYNDYLLHIRFSSPLSKKLGEQLIS